MQLVALLTPNTFFRLRHFLWTTLHMFICRTWSAAHPHPNPTPSHHHYHHNHYWTYRSTSKSQYVNFPVPSIGVIKFQAMAIQFSRVCLRYHDECFVLTGCGYNVQILHELVQLRFRCFIVSSNFMIIVWDRYYTMHSIYCEEGLRFKSINIVYFVIGNYTCLTPYRPLTMYLNLLQSVEQYHAINLAIRAKNIANEYWFCYTSISWCFRRGMIY